MNSKPLTRCYDRLYRLIGCCCQISKIREDDKTSKETGETITKSYNQRISVKTKEEKLQMLNNFDFMSVKITLVTRGTFGCAGAEYP